MKNLKPSLNLKISFFFALFIIKGSFDFLRLNKFSAAMKNKIIHQQPPTIDQNYIHEIYSNLIQKIGLLDQLNQEYKQKQEGHFLKTFMSIIQKLGNQLILAQEAYKNIDFEIKKDSYCLQLAQQLNFFKDQSVNLNKSLNSTKQELRKLKIDRQALQNQLKFTRNLYEKQTNSYLKLKAENKQLKQQLKAIESSKQQSLFNSTGISTAGKELFSKQRQARNLSLDRKLEEFKKATNPQISYNKQQIKQNKQYNAFAPFQLERQNRNSLTLTPVGEFEKISKQGNQTQRSFRAKRQSKEHKSNMPLQYCLE